MVLVHTRMSVRGDLEWLLVRYGWGSDGLMGHGAMGAKGREKKSTGTWWMHASPEAANIAALSEHLVQHTWRTQFAQAIEVHPEVEKQMV